MTITVLSVAVIAEAAVLAGIVTLVARLRTRLMRLSATSSATISQMNELVHEAQALSADLAQQIADQVSLYESLSAQTRTTAARSVTAPDGPQAAPAAPARKAAAKQPAASTAKQAVAATSKEATAATRSRTRKTAEKADAAQSATASAEIDAALARQKGMDPLGVAIQRSLQKGTPTAA